MVTFTFCHLSISYKIITVIYFLMYLFQLLYMRERKKKVRLTFLFNLLYFKKILLIMNSINTLDQESNCSLTKNFLHFTEQVETVLSGFTIYFRIDFDFSSSIGDALCE